MTDQDKVKVCAESVRDTCHLVLRSSALSTRLSDLKPAEREMVNITMDLLRKALEPEPSRPVKNPTQKRE